MRSSVAQWKFFSLFSFYLTLFASPVFCQTAQSSGYLKVATDSIGIEIRLNDKLLGHTPLPIICLPSGKYEIVARHPNPYIWGNFDWQDSILIVPLDTITIRPLFKKLFTVRTTPYDASVFLNNDSLGSTPFAFPINSHKNYQLLLKKNGYQDYTIDLNQVSSNFLTVDLVKNPSQLKLNELAQQRRSKHRYRALTYSFWGLSILTGLSTVYLKDQADAKYQQYLEAGSLKKMNQYYKDSKKYDRYTYISLAALQGCFVLSSYFLIKSLD